MFSSRFMLFLTFKKQIFGVAKNSGGGGGGGVLTFLLEKSLISRFMLFSTLIFFLK